MSYGIAFLPIFIWKKGKRESLLYDHLLSATDANQELKEARLEYLKEVSYCRNLAQDHRSATNEKFLDILISQLPTKDLEGQTIFTFHYFRAELELGTEVNEAMIAERSNLVKMKFFLYKRKKARWITLMNQVKSLTVQPPVFQSDYLTRKIEINFETETGQLPTLALKLRTGICCARAMFRTLAVFAGLVSLYILGNETALMFAKADLISMMLERCAASIWATFLLSCVFLGVLIGFAFFTLFKLKISDYLQLVPKHTDVITMSTFAGLFSQLTAVGCFNYMMLA